MMTNLECPVEDLRENLRVIESDIKEIIGDDPFDFYMASHEDEVYEKINRLLKRRSRCLNRMFRCTSEDVKRVTQVNELLLGLSNSLLRRTGLLCRSTLAARDDSFDDDYEFEGVLHVAVDFDITARDTQDDILQLPDDTHYGSDFYYMAYVVQENERSHRTSFDYIFSCRASGYRESSGLKLDDTALGLENRLDDGQSWIHPFNIPDLDPICICYALHNMLDHHNWSWPDIVRINSYWAEAKAVCQRITNQKGNRYKDISES